MDHLHESYHDPSRRENALDEYEKLVYKPSDGFNNFRNDFVRLAGECQRPKKDWKYEFNRKLTPSLKTQVSTQYLDKKVTFDEFVRQCHAIADIWQRAQKEREGNTNSNKKKSKDGNKGKAPTSSPATTPTTTKTRSRLKWDSCWGKASTELGTLDLTPSSPFSEIERTDPNYLDKYLGGKPFTIACTLINNGLSLTTIDTLVDTGANGYLFVSKRFAKKIMALLKPKKLSNFTPHSVTGHTGVDRNVIDTVLEMCLMIQRRMTGKIPIMVVETGHDMIIGEHFLRKHDILPDCNRHRLLFPD
ncbi:hypothetical protein QBC35DRAFT_396656, partial [Podospora australis]